MLDAKAEALAARLDRDVGLGVERGGVVAQKLVAGARARQRRLDGVERRFGGAVGGLGSRRNFLDERAVGVAVLFAMRAVFLNFLGREIARHAHRQIVHRRREQPADRKSTRLNSSHVRISYAVFCLKKKKTKELPPIPAS